MTIDVLIIGAGVLGLTAAWHLRNMGASVKVVSAQPYQHPVMAHYSWLHPKALTMLPVCQGAPVLGFKVWVTQSCFTWDNLGSLGTIVSLTDVHQQLLGILQDTVQWHAPGHLQETHEGVIYQYENGHTVKARYAIMADGRHTQWYGKRPWQHDADLAITGTVYSDAPHRNIGYQWSTKACTLALLPMPHDHQHTFVLCLPARAAWLWYHQPNWHELAGTTMRYTLGALHHADHLTLHTLYQGMQSAWHKQPVVFPLGDAGHALHPMIGQGLNAGLVVLSYWLTAFSSEHWWSYRMKRTRLLHGLQTIIQGLRYAVNAPCAVSMAKACTITKWHHQCFQWMNGI
jgi:2-polyprenyl-6-methoxyphenol hydroxylase-like FAD-dependent oxidoreductase